MKDEKTVMSETDKLVWEAIARHFKGLKLKKFIPTGSTARVFIVDFPLFGNDSIPRVFKVLRHEEGLLDLFVKEFENEIKILVSLSNTNIVSIFDAGVIKIEEIRVPFYIMEYIENATDLCEIYKKWIDGDICLSREQIINFFLQICNGLKALHSKKLIHCDLKLENIICNSEYSIKLTDFGFSKGFKSENAETGIYTTLTYLPHSYGKYLQRKTSENRIFCKIPHSEINPNFDFHYLGKIIDKFMDEDKIKIILEEYEVRYLKLISKRMDLDAGHNLPRYTSVNEIIEDFSKLSMPKNFYSTIPEIDNTSIIKNIRIALSGSVVFSERVMAIVNHPVFQRLRNIPQLGFAYYVYPSAFHTRFEHSLGVFSNTIRYINALNSHIVQPYFKQFVNRGKIETTLVASLLHDVAHHPFTHAMEDSGILESHERITRTFITGEGLERFLPEKYIKTCPPLKDIIKQYWPEVDLTMLLWLITGEMDDPSKAINELDPGWQMLRKIIDGPIDADKTDYLLRDAYHAGVEYASNIDTSRFFSTIVGLVQEDPADERMEGSEVGVTWKGIPSMENITLIRYQMFNVVYWHHTIRAFHAMFNRCIVKLLLLGHDINALYHLLYATSIPHMIDYIKDNPTDGNLKLIGECFQRRMPFKRLYTIEKRKNQRIYRDIIQLADVHKKEDIGMLQFTSAFVNELKTKSSFGIELNDIIFDIPPSGKEDTSPVFVINKKNRIEKFQSRLIEGGAEDFEENTKRIRIFINPHKVSYIEDINRFTKFALESAIKKYKDKKYEKMKLSSHSGKQGGIE